MRVFHSFLVLAACVAGASAHSFMSVPKPEYEQVCARNRDGKSECFGPCMPDEMGWKETGTSASNPAATYKRGQVIETQHFRNNHERGFVRYSIVPLDQKMNAAAHGKFAFRYACYTDKKIECNGNCGSDTQMFGTRVTIPTYVPDGVYIFSWAWFGGGYKGFSDMYTCSYVEIKGGPMTASGVPVFESTGTFTVPGKCRSHANRLGICLWTPCVNTTPGDDTDMVPAGFEDGQAPPAITTADYGGTVDTPETTPQAPTQPPTQAPTQAPTQPPTEPPTSPAVVEEPKVITTSMTQSPPVATMVASETTTNQTTTMMEEASMETPEATSEYPAEESPAEEYGLYFQVYGAGTAETHKIGPIFTAETGSFCGSEEEYPAGWSLYCKGISEGQHKVDFFVNDRLVKTERVAPYTIAGDRTKDKARIGAWKHPVGLTTIKCVVDGKESIEVTVDLCA